MWRSDRENRYPANIALALQGSHIRFQNSAMNEVRNIPHLAVPIAAAVRCFPPTPASAPRPPSRASPAVPPGPPAASRPKGPRRPPRTERRCAAGRWPAAAHWPTAARQACGQRQSSGHAACPAQPSRLWTHAVPPYAWQPPALTEGEGCTCIQGPSRQRKPLRRPRNISHQGKGDCSYVTFPHRHVLGRWH